MKKYVCAFFCIIIAAMTLESQAQNIRFHSSINRNEKPDSFPTYEHLMLLCIADLYSNQNNPSKTENRSNYYLFASDSIHIFYNLMKTTEDGFERYLPKKTESKVFPFRKSANIAQYVLEQIDKGKMVSLGSLNKRKYIVQSF